MSYLDSVKTSVVNLAKENKFLPADQNFDNLSFTPIYIAPTNTKQYFINTINKYLTKAEHEETQKYNTLHNKNLEATKFEDNTKTFMLIGTALAFIGLRLSYVNNDKKLYLAFTGMALLALSGLVYTISRIENSKNRTEETKTDSNLNLINQLKELRANLETSISNAN